jgi:hypothetical protein
MQSTKNLLVQKEIAHNASENVLYMVAAATTGEW